MSGVFEDIDESSERDVRLFWKLIRRLKPRSSRTYYVSENNGEQFGDPPISQIFIMPKKIQTIIPTSSLQLKSAKVNSNALPAHQMIVSQEVLRPSTKYKPSFVISNAEKRLVSISFKTIILFIVVYI